LGKKPVCLGVDAMTMEAIWELSGGEERGYVDYREVIKGLMHYKAAIYSTQVLFQPLQAARKTLPGSQPRSLFGEALVTPGDIFRAIDRDGDGSVSLRELETGLKRLDLPLSIEMLRDLMSLFALDREGGVSRGEFLRQTRLFASEAQNTAPHAVSPAGTREPLSLIPPPRGGAVREGLSPCDSLSSLDDDIPRASILALSPSPGHRELQQALRACNESEESEERERESPIREAREGMALYTPRAIGSSAHTAGGKRKAVYRLLIDAVKRGTHREVKRILLHGGGDPRQRLEKADLVSDFCDLRAMKDPVLGEASTVLHLACIMQHIKVARVLTLCGANIWDLDMRGQDPVSLLHEEEARAELCRLSELVLETNHGHDSDEDDERERMVY